MSHELQIRLDVDVYALIFVLGMAANCTSLDMAMPRPIDRCLRGEEKMRGGPVRWKRSGRRGLCVEITQHPLGYHPGYHLCI